jgi:outer membrane protein assembly factor BamA
MIVKFKFYFFTSLLLFSFFVAKAQTFEMDAGNVDSKSGSSAVAGFDTTYTPFIVRHIYITGNKKTRANIIRRELGFDEGEHFALPALVGKFENARRQLINTALFHEAVVSLKSLVGYEVDVLVSVKERWYIFPVPYFKIIDRNLNQWWVESKRSLDRVNYGAKFFHNNLTGRNDQLNIWLTNGYAKQAMINYDRMFIDKNMKWGLKAGMALGKNREVNYNTVDNKQVFVKDGNKFLREYFNANAEITYRPFLYTRHRLGFSYYKESISDTVFALNAQYLNESKRDFSFPELYYDVQYANVDYIPYPLKGVSAQLRISKRGWNNDMNLWQMTARGYRGWALSPKYFFGLNAAAILKLPFDQPYYAKPLLGYNGMMMQGYEYYVVDGVAGGYLKGTLSRELLKFRVPIPPNKIDGLSAIPFRVYGKIYTNVGYVHNPNPGSNYLNNRFLYSGGMGLDIVTIYDFIIKFEWSFNLLGQNGLYLHNKTNF